MLDNDGDRSGLIFPGIFSGAAPRIYFLACTLCRFRDLRNSIKDPFFRDVSECLILSGKRSLRAVFVQGRRTHGIGDRSVQIRDQGTKFRSGSIPKFPQESHILPARAASLSPSCAKEIRPYRRWLPAFLPERNSVNRCICSCS